MIVAGIIRSCGRVGHSTADTRWVKDCRMGSNESNVLVMSVESSKIHDVRSSAVSYTNDFRWPPEAEILGIEVRGECNVG
ncbi:hypothetical protein TNCV_1256531 [Trichonephila clavipes]|nr:hypothetical protein TNCV_1256531 [Trichonephila clavipes]